MAEARLIPKLVIVMNRLEPRREIMGWIFVVCITGWVMFRVVTSAHLINGTELPLELGHLQGADIRSPKFWG